MENTNNKAIADQDYFMPIAKLPVPPELKDVPGAKTWLMEGHEHGILGTSILVAEVAPGEGPPLHLHFTEEIQYVLEGHLSFIIGDKRFEVSEPGIVHIPAQTTHAFVNIGTQPMRVVTFFPTSSYTLNWQNVGPNPLR